MVARRFLYKWFFRIFLCFVFGCCGLSRGRADRNYGRGSEGPAKNAAKRAIQSIIWRILIFYIGAIFVIVTVYPWNELHSLGSPFVSTFAKVGITAAA
ncbi:hypothetical protein O7R04_01215 [Bacillus velezensis]|nr:hypothetical protein [Bacillus velezensis]WBL39574.1 hypothetical protein O7R04_01215 [Bacillus velezensis]